MIIKNQIGLHKKELGMDLMNKSLMHIFQLYQKKNQQNNLKLLKIELDNNFFCFFHK